MPRQLRYDSIEGHWIMEQIELDRIADNEADMQPSQQIQSRINYAKRDRRDRFLTCAMLSGFGVVVIGLVLIIVRAALQ
jgi:hypothetical protein